MIVPLLVGIVAVFLTYLSKHTQNGYGLKAAFFLIFVFLGIRYDYGNDYLTYLQRFESISFWGTQIKITGENWEPGWVFLHLIFHPFGFFALIAFTSLLTAVVYYRFIRNYVPAKYQWFAVYLYFFDPYTMLIPASAMRQSFAVLLFLIAFEFLHKKKSHILIYIIIVLMAASVHKTAYILLLIAFFPFFNIKLNKFVATLFVLFLSSLFFFGGQILLYVNAVVESLFPDYVKSYLYYGGVSINSGIGFIYVIFQMLSILYFAGVEFTSHGQDDMLEINDTANSDYYDYGGNNTAVPLKLNLSARRLFFKIAILTFIILPISLHIVMFGRLNMYFLPMLIVVYPMILNTTKDRFFHFILMYSLLGFTMFKFVVFFINPIWHDKFSTYQTIFSTF